LPSALLACQGPGGGAAVPVDSEAETALWTRKYQEALARVRQAARLGRVELP
jgi:hypothetical protein